MASRAHPALGQHPTHNPPPARPPARPPVHQPPPRQVVKPQTSQPQKSVVPQPQRQVVPQPPRQQQELSIPGAVTPPAQTQTPAVGTRVPHPPVRPWEQRNQTIPPAERPPPGMCRVWLDNVPAASQPAPTTCSKAIQMHPPNGHVVFGEDGRRPTARRVPPATPPESSAPDSPLADH